MKQLSLFPPRFTTVILFPPSCFSLIRRRITASVVADQNDDDGPPLRPVDGTEDPLAARGVGRGRGSAAVNRRRESGRSNSNEHHQTL